MKKMWLLQLVAQTIIQMLFLLTPLYLGGSRIILCVIQAGFRKGRGARDHIANIRWIIKKAREFQKNIYFCLIDYAKAFDCVDLLWKMLK